MSEKNPHAHLEKLAGDVAKKLLERAEWYDVEDFIDQHGYLDSDGDFTYVISEVDNSRVIRLVRDATPKINPLDEVANALEAYARETLGFEMQPWQKKIIESAFQSQGEEQ